MTNKIAIKQIKNCIDEIATHEQSDKMLDCLNFICNLMANDVGTEFLRGGSIERKFTIEELQIVVTYVGDRHVSRN